MALCGRECLELTSEAIKILSINFYCNKQIENNENFYEKHYQNWKNSSSVVNEKFYHLVEISLFNTLALSKIIDLTLITILELNKIQKIIYLVW